MRMLGDPDDCLVCSTPDADAKLYRMLVWENDLWRLTASLVAEVRGFCALEPKRHISHITDLDGEEAETFGPVLARVSNVLRLVTAADVIYLYHFGDGIPHLIVYLGPHREGDALSSQMVRGPVVTQRLPSGAELFVSEDHPPLLESELRDTAQSIADRLSS